MKLEVNKEKDDASNNSSFLMNNSDEESDVSEDMSPSPSKKNKDLNTSSKSKL